MRTVAHQLDLDLFGGRGRLPRRPYCTDDLSAGLRIRSLEQALTQPYIQINPPHLRVWSIHDCDYRGAALAWEDADLPPPSWTTVNRANGHAHLVWGLAAPVLVDSLHAREGAMRYLAAVEACMRERLHADAGYSGLITKNPVHPLWYTLRGPIMGYELGELAEWLPELDKYRPKRGRVEEVGLGRNVTVFDRTRPWAYSTIREYWGGGLSAWNAYLSAVYDRALDYNDFYYPLTEREVWHIARSIARWVWRNFTPSTFAVYVAATHTSDRQRARRLNKSLHEALRNEYGQDS